MKKEINIVGAGISGLTAAINLAKAGFKVRVFEKNDTVGKRFSGDYQGIENWVYDQDALEHLKNLNLEINFPYYLVKEVNIIGPDRKIHHYKFEKSLVYLVKRGTKEDTLDQALLKQAQRVGAEIIFNSEKNHLEFGDIIARGYFPDKVTDGIVVGYNFKTDVKDQYWGILDNNVAPVGYAYCLCTNGKITLAVCIFKDFSKNKEYLEKAYNIFQKIIGFQAEDKIFFAGISDSLISDFLWSKTAVFKGRLYVGETAGFIDNLWGFGIKYAMISGYLAAKSIIGSKDYDKLWKEYILPQLKASLVNRFYCNLLNNKIYQMILEKLENSKHPINFLKKTYNYSLIHRIGFPFARLFLRKNIKDPRKFK